MSGYPAQPGSLACCLCPTFRHFNVATNFRFATVAAPSGSGMSTRLYHSSKNESFPVFSGITLRKEAKLDIKNAFEYYEIQRLGLDHDFLHCVEEALSKIERNPTPYKNNP
jgi:hypothetical protein